MSEIGHCCLPQDADKKESCAKSEEKERDDVILLLAPPPPPFTTEDLLRQESGVPRRLHAEGYYSRDQGEMSTGVRLRTNSIAL